MAELTKGEIAEASHKYFFDWMDIFEIAIELESERRDLKEEVTGTRNLGLGQDVSPEKVERGLKKAGIEVSGELQDYDLDRELELVEEKLSSQERQRIDENYFAVSEIDHLAEEDLVKAYLIEHKEAPRSEISEFISEVYGEQKDVGGLLRRSTWAYQLNGSKFGVNLWNNDEPPEIAKTAARAYQKQNSSAL